MLLIGAQDQYIEDGVWLLDFPAIRTLRVSHADQRPHGEQASLDRAGLRRVLDADPGAHIEFTLLLADSRPFELAELHGHSLKILVVPSAGPVEHLVMDTRLSVVGTEAFVVADCPAATFLANLTGTGEHRVGLAPWTEILQASAEQMAELVSAESPSLLLVDIQHLEIEPLIVTPERLPTAPGLTNHLTIGVHVASDSFGLDLASALPLLNCALISVSGD